MSWRNQDTHIDETKAVKAALLAAGMDVRKVGHGRGTSYGWLYIFLARPLEHGCEEHGTYGDFRDRQACIACRNFFEKCQELNRKAVETAQKVTGRRGEYDGRINVHLESL